MKSALSIIVMTLIVVCRAPSVRSEEQVYLNKAQAFELLFGKEVSVVYDPQSISSELNDQLKEANLQGSQESEKAHFFVAQKADRPIGYALIDSEIGKHMPITYIVGISLTGSVTRVEIMVYREAIGWEARERAFMQQFEGRASSEKLKLGEGIRHVSGATLSSRAITKGVNRALFLWRHFYAGGQHS